MVVIRFLIRGRFIYSSISTSANNKFSISDTLQCHKDILFAGSFNPSRLYLSQSAHLLSLLLRKLEDVEEDQSHVESRLGFT